jgi:hypothetical protein
LASGLLVALPAARHPPGPRACGILTAAGR